MTGAIAVDGLFQLLTGTSVFLLTLITGLMVVFVVRSRRRGNAAEDGTEETIPHEEPAPAAARRRVALEVAWTTMSAALVLVIFAWGVRQSVRASVEPPGAYEIVATGQMWQWSFTYPNGYTDPELHVPAGTPVRVTVVSKDVIHGLSVPALGVNQDAVPGRPNRAWFAASEAGTFDLYCTGYCGTNHSTMVSRVVVQEPGEFRKWLSDAGAKALDLPPAELGKKLYETQGCAVCHSVDGTPRVGPTWKGAFGSQVPLADGRSVLADEVYLRESILEPTAKVHAGFGPVMPRFDQLKPRDVDGLVAYIKTLGGPPAPGAQPATQPATAPTMGPTTLPAAAGKK